MNTLCTIAHPWSTCVFVAVCWLVVLVTVYTYPANTVIGMTIVLSGIPVYYFWQWWNRKERKK